MRRRERLACSRLRSLRSIFWDSVRDAAGLEDAPFSEVVVVVGLVVVVARPAWAAVRLAGTEDDVVVVGGTGAGAGVAAAVVVAAIVVVVDAAGSGAMGAGAIGALVLVTGSGNVKSSK